MRFARLPFLLSACLLAAGCCSTAPVKTGTAQDDCSDCGNCCCNAPQVAITYSAPVVVEQRVQHRQRAYALQPAPTLPCAPGYCPMRKARRDRN